MGAHHGDDIQLDVSEVCCSSLPKRREPSVDEREGDQGSFGKRSLQSMNLVSSAHAHTCMHVCVCVLRCLRVRRSSATLQGSRHRSPGSHADYCGDDVRRVLLLRLVFEPIGHVY